MESKESAFITNRGKSVASLQAPGSIKVAAGVGFLEALAIAGYSVIMIISAGASETGMGRIIALAIFFLVIAAVIAFSACKLLAGKPSARSMLLVWQLFAVILGVQTGVGGQLFIGLLAVFLGGLAIMMLFSSSVNAFFEAHSSGRSLDRDL